MNECDPLDIAAARQGLKTNSFGQQIVYHESVGSTNDVAKDLAEAGAPEGTVVFADVQTSGRGRMSRSWLAPPCSSILLSIVIRPDLPSYQLGRLPIAFGVGLAAAVSLQTGLDARLKWPNDILINGKKCAGILAEGQILGEQLQYAVVGMGVNVNFAAASIEGIPSDATTLSDELGRHLAREPLLQAILEECEVRYLAIHDAKAIAAEWRSRSLILGRQIRAAAPWGVENGIAEDIDADGALLMRRENGSVIRLTASDVSLIVLPDQVKKER